MKIASTQMQEIRILYSFFHFLFSWHYMWCLPVSTSVSHAAHMDRQLRKNTSSGTVRGSVVAVFCGVQTFSVLPADRQTFFRLAIDPASHCRKRLSGQLLVFSGLPL